MRLARIKNFYFRYSRLLSRADKNKLGIILVLQILVSFLDVIGIALIGVVGALTVTGIQSSKPTGKISEIIELLRLSDNSFQGQVAILGLVAATVLLSRTFISIYFTRKTLYFFTYRSALLSSQLISKLMTQNLLKIQEKTSQELLFATTYGTTSLMVGVFANAANFVGNGSQLTGMYSNTNVSSFLPTYTGVVKAGSIKTDNLLYANGDPWTLGGGTVTGDGSTLFDLNAANVTGTFTSLNVLGAGNINIGGGTAGQLLTVDSVGNLLWIDPQQGGSGGSYLINGKIGRAHV